MEAILAVKNGQLGPYTAANSDLDIWVCMHLV